jgi:uncharacterized protein (TIGR02001 family)
MRYSMISLGALMLASTAPAMAQDASETEPAPAITVTGSVTATTDYRFRGLSQTNKGAAAQSSININHESGLYVGTWVSTLDDQTSLPGYGDAEVDLYAGYTKTLDSGVGFDVGMLYYFYVDAPSRFGGADNDTDFFEPYASVNYTLGPVNVKVGGNYAWSGQSGLGDDDSLYLYSNVAASIPNTPVKLLGHVGRSKGALGAFNLDAADDSYLDWSLGAEVSQKGITLGVQYVDTDITSTRILGERFNSLVGGNQTVLGYLTFAF